MPNLDAHAVEGENKQDSHIVPHITKGDDRGATEMFGSLKTALESLSTGCAHYEVRFRCRTGTSPLTDPSAGNRQRQNRYHRTRRGGEGSLE